MSTAFVYRQAHLDEAGLLALLTRVFDNGLVWAFGANTIWIDPIALLAVTEVKLHHARYGRLDSGHVFLPRAEVRWKRRGSVYDALVLTETVIDGLLPLHDAHQAPVVLTIASTRPDASMLLTTAHEASQRGKQWKLGYREYAAANGAVQFVRYTELREEPLT